MRSRDKRLTTYHVAQLKIQDADVVVIFLEGGLHLKTRPQDRQELYRTLRNCAVRAGLPGEVVAVWPDDFARTRFIAPAQQHPFFQAVSYDQLYAQVNGTLGC